MSLHCDCENCCKQNAGTADCPDECECDCSCPGTYPFCDE